MVSVARQNRRERLTEIVSRLGEDATPAEIREEAYRVGFGAVNASMLSFVRTRLFPDRKKRTSGLEARSDPTVLSVSPDQAGLLRCPECRSPNTRTKDSRLQADGLRKRWHICKDCGHRFQALSESRNERVRSERRIAMWATHKTCSRCKRMLPVTSFGKKSGDAHLYRAACRNCMNEQRRHYYRKQIDRQYGISHDDYRKMMTRQGGVCAICGKPKSGRRGKRGFSLAIDHCHRTGTVRGLLCNKCNLGIGNFDDDVSRLRRAIAYIVKDHGNITRMGKEVNYG